LIIYQDSETAEFISFKSSFAHK